MPIAALLLVSLAGCGTTGQAERERPLVLTTFTVIADIARNVAGEHLDVESITKVGAEIHGYEPTPGDLRRAAGADLIVDNGLGLEAWFDQFLQDVDAPRVTVSAGVDPIDIAADAYAGRPNPHAWMSPLNVEIYVDNLVAAFSELDPAHADDYAANGEAYAAELRAVQDDLVERLAALPPDHRALVTCEGAFSYLARDAELTEVYIWPVNAEQQATPQQIAAVIDEVDADDIPAVFCESTVSDRAMQQVVEATGTTFGGILYVDSLSDEDGPVPTYLDLVRYNANVIAEALAGSAG
jgi:manganese transport system substrate-binding protein